MKSSLHWLKKAKDGTAGKRKKGRSKRGYKDQLKKDIMAAGLRLKDALDLADWRRKIHSDFIFYQKSEGCPAYIQFYKIKNPDNSTCSRRV